MLIGRGVGLVITHYTHGFIGILGRQTNVLSVVRLKMFSGQIKVISIKELVATGLNCVVFVTTNTTKLVKNYGIVGG